MAGKIKINLGNKTFYTLIVIAALLVISGIVIAWQSGNPEVMGHTSDEIKDFNESVRQIIYESLGLGDCTTKISTTLTGGVSEKSTTSIAIPSVCRVTTGENGCVMTFKVLKDEGVVYYIKQGTYSQFLDNKWISTQTPAGGTNGDLVKTKIISYSYLYLYDDDKDVESSPNNWVLVDNSGSMGVELYICQNV